jgi:hypothetical protein
VDIEGDPQLVRQFGESIPVVEIDGRVRFRGRIDWRLLQRMIDAAELRRSVQENAEPASDLRTEISAARRLDS